MLESQCAGLNFTLWYDLNQVTPGSTQVTLLGSLPCRCGFRHLFLSGKELDWKGECLTLHKVPLQEEIRAKGSVGKLGLSVGLRPVFQHDSSLVRKNQMFLDVWSRRRVRAREEVGAS